MTDTTEHKLTLTDGRTVDYDIVMTLAEFYNARIYELTYSAYHDGKEIEVSDIGPDNHAGTWFDIRPDTGNNCFQVKHLLSRGAWPYKTAFNIPGTDRVYLELIDPANWQARIDRTAELLADYAPEVESKKQDAG
jgi:hypothetical protein